MAWVAFDRGIRLHDEFGREGPVERWRAIRDEIRAEVLARGWSERKRAFTQSYDSDELDASVLMMAMVDFLPADDPRMVATVEAIQRELTVEGFVLRYRAEESGVDGLPGGEGVFLACSFWLVEVLAMQGKRDEARVLFERLLSLRNDVGLLAEEYDPIGKRQLGNFPQAFSHVGLINTALNLSRQAKPAEQRSETSAPEEATNE
jgi:GH15 family glucan-1,4-alpha-glucosidase